MQSVEIKGLAELDKALSDMLTEFPDARREMHERISKKVEENVRSKINASGLNDSLGRVKGWQEGRVGSGGGYAAVSAIRGATGADSPGAITNYLENGHKIRPPGKTMPRAKRAYVNGYHFYAAASEQAQAIAVAEAETMLNELAGKLEG